MTVEPVELLVHPHVHAAVFCCLIVGVEALSKVCLEHKLYQPCTRGICVGMYHHI